MSAPKLSLKARVARLDQLIPEDGDRLCCLEGFTAYKSTVAPWCKSLGTHLTDPDPPVDPPVLPLGGICKKTGEGLCPFALERAALVWSRRRRVAITTAGLSESDL